MAYGNDPGQHYEQLLRTATPAALQKAHSEAFAKLTPAQRELIFEKLLAGAQAPDERPVNANAYALAATATLVEGRRPGTLKRIFDELSTNPVWNLPGSTFYGMFGGIAVGLGLAFGLGLTIDPGTALAGGVDPGANPGGLFGDFGGGGDFGGIL
jgi:hypothetical protein